MLPRSLQIRLRDALYFAFAQGEAAFDDMLAPLDKSLLGLAPRVETYPNRILAVIEAADQQGWIGKLMAAVRESRPADPALEQLAGEIAQVLPPPCADHFEACRLSGGHVMVDRHDLRAALRELAAPTGKRILVVKGDSRSGKSHSVQLISYLRQFRGGFTMAVVDLEDFGWKAATGALVEPTDVAGQLVRLMRYDFALPEPPKDAQWARWVYEFCVQFESRALQDATQWWIVIDTFDKVLLKQPVFDLVKELTLRINRSLPGLRLVLIGYGETFPGSVLPIVQEEVIHPIGPGELIDFFARAYDEMGTPCGEDDVAGAVQRVLDQLEPGSPDFLDRLGTLAHGELARAAAGGRR